MWKRGWTGHLLNKGQLAGWHAGDRGLSEACLRLPHASRLLSRREASPAASECISAVLGFGLTTQVTSQLVTEQELRCHARSTQASPTFPAGPRTPAVRLRLKLGVSNRVSRKPFNGLWTFKRDFHTYSCKYMLRRLLTSGSLSSISDHPGQVLGPRKD